MVHRIFKNLVPKTNCKNVELDLLKRYITLFAIRHLIDGGVDIRLSRSNQGFASISQDLKKLFSNWFITKANNFVQLDHEDTDIEGYYYYYLIIIPYFTPFKITCYYVCAGKFVSKMVPINF